MFHSSCIFNKPFASQSLRRGFEGEKKQKQKHRVFRETWGSKMQVEISGKSVKMWWTEVVGGGYLAAAAAAACLIPGLTWGYAAKWDQVTQNIHQSCRIIKGRINMWWGLISCGNISFVTFSDLFFFYKKKKKHVCGTVYLFLNFII